MAKLGAIGRSVWTRVQSTMGSKNALDERD